MIFKMAEFIEGQDNQSNFFLDNYKGYQEIIKYGAK